MPVKVIKARTAPVVERAARPKLRVAAYCRVSTDSDEQEISYDAQVSHYTAFINDNPAWTLAGIYADQGLSGTQAKTRPEFNRMIEACERHEVDMVITKSISRFARNTLDCLNYIRSLKALGIPIIFEKEAINTMESAGEVLVTILASIAQQESASISQNVRMGIQFGFQEGRGRVNFSSFLGYKRGAKAGTYEIIPEEADVVRRIYRQYLEGYSPNMIADMLTAEGILTASGGKKWYPSAIRSITENEKYAGELLMQKYYTKDFLTHEVAKNTGQKPQYFVEDDHDPIVPKAIFYQVQGERKRRSELRLNPRKLRFGKRIALSGRLICGKCGRTLKRYVKPDENLTDWRCRRRAMVKKSDVKEQPGARCDCRIVGEREVQAAVIAAFNELPRRRDELIAMDERLLTGEIGRIDALIASLAEQQEQLEERLEALAADEPMNTAVVDVVGEAAQMAGTEAQFLKSQIVEIRRQKDALYEERADHANREVQIKILLELVDQMISAGNSEWRHLLEGREEEHKAETPACYDYDDFFRRTAYRIKDGILDESGRMMRFDNDLVIRYLENVVVRGDGYEVRFKAGVNSYILRG